MANTFKKAPATRAGNERGINKLWNAERPMINHVMKAKGFKRTAFPRGAIPPYHSLKRLLKLQSTADFKKAAHGSVGKSRKILEHSRSLPSPRNQKGNVMPKSLHMTFHPPG
jgi:hypothetical protein